MDIKSLYMSYVWVVPLCKSLLHAHDIKQWSSHHFGTPKKKAQPNNAHYFIPDILRN